MKQTIKITTSMLLVFWLIFGALACAPQVDATGLWENATYLSDTTLGEGANTVKLRLTAGEQTVVFTVKTDKATLGEALFELGLTNDPTFFDTCNGIKADWNKDKAYWAFYVGDSETIADFGIGDTRAVTTGDPTYRIVYTK